MHLTGMQLFLYNCVIDNVDHYDIAGRSFLMKIARKALALVLALVLMLSMAAFPAAQADTIVKSVHGAFAAEEKLLSRIFMILPTDAGSSLYSMPAQGGTVTLIESAQQINDVIAGSDGTVYYLCYTGSVFQVVARTMDGTRKTLAEFQPGQLAYSLSLYNGALYCLVDNKLMMVDANGMGTTLVSDNAMVAYTIASDIVYFQSAEDEVEYQKPYTRADGSSVTVTTSSGKLYAMNIDGTNAMQQFDQGVSNLAAYGEYVYFHNYNDSYVVDGNPDAWLDGKLYRLNVQTNQFKLLRDGYDWNYRPVDLGLVIYQQKSISIAAQDGTNPVLLYEPDPYNYLVLLDDCAIVYEYNLQKLTRVPYDMTGAVQLWSGPFVTDGSAGTVIENNTAAQTAGSDNTQTTTTQTTTTQTNTATSTGSTASSGVTGVTPNGSIMYGATGEKVREIQTRLKELGYLNYVDGIFGSNTLTAVKRFQRAAGLTVDGIVGKGTLAKLNSSSAPEYDGSTATDSSYIFPNSSKKKLTEEEILSINKSLWPYARNEIYARHGYSFDTAKFRNYFANKTWYKEGGFSTKDLNSIEWYNMELIRDMEEEYADDDEDEVDYKEEYIFPQSSTRKLTKAEIREVDEELWPFARNEIYARHGYKFTKAKFKNYFEDKSWYKAGGFSTKDLSDIEWYNMELIAWMEKNEG